LEKLLDEATEVGRRRSEDCWKKRGGESSERQRIKKIEVGQ
jgi:hypothetical protein